MRLENLGKAMEHLRRHRQQDGIGIRRLSQIACDRQILWQRHARQKPVFAPGANIGQDIVFPYPQGYTAPGRPGRQGKCGARRRRR